MMLEVPTMIKIALTALVAQCLYYRYLHPLSHYPGPFLASFTNLWKFINFFGGEHHLVEEKLHHQYGHVVRTGPNSLSFSNLGDFDAIYGFNKGIEKGDFYHFGRDERRIENVFSARTDASHREHRRKVVGPALLAAKVSSYEPTVAKNAAILVARLQVLADDDGAVVNVASLVHRYTFDTMVEIIYGAPLCSKPYTDLKASDGILAAFRIMSKMAWGGSLLPWFGWLMSTAPMVKLIRRPTFDAEGQLTGMAALASRTQDIVILRPEQAIQSSEPSIVKNYLAVTTDHPAHMPPPQIWRESFNLTFAGPGSTAAALTSVLYQLGTPEGLKWQAQIRAEHSMTGPVPSSPITPLLTVIIKETLRLHAPFPTAFPRTITPGAESAIPGLPAPLPVGTTVSAHTYILGRSTALWGADAAMWKPQRWMQDGREENEGEKRALDEKFVAFGKGARGCIGKDIALLVVARAVVAMLMVWEVRSVGELKGKSWLEMQYDECVLELTRVK